MKECPTPQESLGIRAIVTVTAMLQAETVTVIHLLIWHLTV
jgi:hypothetical protein